MKDELTELAIKYGSGRHPWSKHCYTPYYYELFQNRRKSIRKILEIGVGEGKDTTTVLLSSNTNGIK